MTKFIYLFGLILSIGFVACKQDHVPDTGQEVQEVKVTFLTKIQTASSDDGFGDLKSTSLYDRNGAPVYVDGIEITAVNHDLYSYGTKTETFMFEPEGSIDGDNPVEMIVGVGASDFSAVGVPAYSEGNWIATYFALKDKSATIAERAAAYSSILIGKRPIYVEYATDSIAKQVVSFNTTWYDALSVDDPYDNSVDDDGLTLKEMQEYIKDGETELRYWERGYFSIWPGFVEFTLTPQTGRTSIVFESDVNLNFRVTPTLYAADGSKLAALSIDQDKGTHTTASALIFNSSDMVDGTYIEVLVEKSETGASWSYHPVTDASNITVPTQVGKNITYVITYKGDSKVDTQASVANYNPVVVDNSQGQIIDEN